MTKRNDTELHSLQREDRTARGLLQSQQPLPPHQHGSWRWWLTSRKHAPHTHQCGTGEQLQIPRGILPYPRADPAFIKRSIKTSTFSGGWVQQSSIPSTDVQWRASWDTASYSHWNTEDRGFFNCCWKQSCLIHHQYQASHHGGYLHQKVSEKGQEYHEEHDSPHPLIIHPTLFGSHRLPELGIFFSTNHSANQQVNRLHNDPPIPVQTLAWVATSYTTSTTQILFLSSQGVLSCHRHIWLAL